VKRGRESGGALDELFGALSDPTRRSLMQRLVQSGPATATVLSAGAPLSRQAIVKHLQALVDAGLATPERHGREVRYVATPAPLADAVAWLIETSPQWDRRIDRLRKIAQERTSADLSMR
jgi:DNA-binding transcriptional ArsR family regulator